MKENYTERLVAYLAHELRQPMYGMRALMEQELENEEMDRNRLKLCQNNMEELIAFTTDILERIRDGNPFWGNNVQAISKQQIQDYIEATIQPFAAEQNCYLMVEIQGMEEIYLYMHKEWLYEMIMNLTFNSLKHVGEDGWTVISLKVTPKEEYRVHVELKVEDNGCGMSEEFVERATMLFEKGEHQKADEPEEIPGYGVGLAVTQKIVDSIKGTMQITSKPDKGTSVCIRFEADASEEFYEKAQKEEPQRRSDAHCLRKKKILIAENDELYMELITELLEKNGALVDKTYDGEEVVDLFADSAPGEYQMILMDLTMPEKDGSTATKEIRRMNRPDADVIPVVAFTGYPISDERAFLAENQMQGILPKVFDENEMIEVLSRLLS